MSDTPETPQAGETWEDRAVDIFIDHLRLDRLSDIRLTEIAAEAAVDFGRFYQRFANHEALLIAFGQRIDRQTLAVDPDDYAGEPVRDRLFDIIMRRFEALGPYKDSVRGLADALRRDPILAASLTGPFRQAMTGMLMVAGIDMRGPLAHVRGLAFSGAYLSVVRVWLKDASPDRGETMAALDKALDRIAFLTRERGAAGAQSAPDGSMAQ